MLRNAGQVLAERARLSSKVEAWIDATTGERVTFREANARANRIAHLLRARGLEPGERVAVLMPNVPQHVAAFYACAKTGVVFVALNWRLTAAELEFQLRDCGASAVLFGSDFAAVAGELAPHFSALHWIALDGAEIAAELGAQSDEEPMPGACDDDALFMMYTSGTTGRPKGAVLSHRANLEWMTSMMATSDMRFGERQIIVAPLFHIGGLGMAMCGVIRSGTSVLMRGFDPGLVWQTIEREQITCTFAVPAMLTSMLAHPARATTDVSSLRAIICGAAPVPVSLIEQYAALGIEIHQVYGLTETHGGVCILAPGDARAKAGSTGLPYFGIEVRVVDSHGRDVAPGVPGEVVARGPNLFSGYWNNPDATREAMRDGWFHTGDIAETDAEGYVYIKDRSKDMIISGGENVYPAEVENVLYSHPGVGDVGVIGQPSARWGECACAVIVRSKSWQGDDGLLVAELTAHVQARLARYKQPRTFEFVESLPRNPAGKILKRLLRERFPGPAPE